MNRQQKISALLARGPDDIRRLALDEIDKTARDTRTFGSDQHRTARDKVERDYDRSRKLFEDLGEEELDRVMAAQPA